MWPPRIMANDSALEKYALPGNSVTVSLPALIRSRVLFARQRIRADAEHAVFRLQNHLDAWWHVVRDHGGNSDAEVDVIAVAQFLRHAAGDALTRVHPQACPQSSSLDGLLVLFALHDALNVNAGRADVIGIDSARLHQLLHLGNGDFRGGRHHRIEVLRGFSINEIAQPVATPGFDQREIGGERAFQQVAAAVELAHLFAVRDHRPHAGRRIKCGNACAARANSLGQRALRDERQLELARQHQRFQQLVFAHVAAQVRSDHAGLQHDAGADAVDAQVVADGVQSCDASSHQGAIRFSGMPPSPKPPSIMVAPSGISATAASEESKTLFMLRKLCSCSDHS